MDGGEWGGDARVVAVFPRFLLEPDQLWNYVVQH